MKSETDLKIEARLEKWEKKEGSLSPWLEFYRDMLRIQSGIAEKIGELEIAVDREDADRKLFNGRPFLRFDDLVLDWNIVAEAWHEIATLFRNNAPLLGDVNPELADDSVVKKTLLKKTVEAWFDGADLPHKLIELAGNSVLLDALILSAMRPFLKSHQLAVGKPYDLDNWRRSDCPVCGGNADFGYLEKEVGARWLVCSRCDAEWLFQRTVCPYCENNDQTKLSFFPDESEQYRLYVCEKCRHYLKTIDLRKCQDRDEEVLMPLERFLTSDLDAQAYQQGYLPGPAVKSASKTKSR